MRCVVTAGPTYEPLDAVRRLTNLSTGQLGTELANFLTAAGHDVTLLLGELATWAGARRAGRVVRFGTGSELRARLEDLGEEEIEGVFHAAAVSDFAFGRVWRQDPQGRLTPVKWAKLPTAEGTLLAELLPTRKVMGDLRRMFSGAWIVGWKYEVERGQSEAIRAGDQQLGDYGTDACVVNGPAYGEGFGLVWGRGQCRHLADKASLFSELERRLRGAGRGGG